MRTWGGVAAVAVLLAGCGPGGPRPRPDAAAPPVDDGAVLETLPAAGVGEATILRFDWPDGLAGRCRSRRLVAGDGRAEPPREVTFRVRVERGADELRILTDEVAGADERLLGEEAPGPLVETVEPDGRYREAEGVEQALAGAGSVATARAVDEVRARLAQTWKLLVGAWAGRELPLGAAYSAAAPEVMPGGRTLRVRIAIQADGNVPCRRGAASAGCIRLRLVSQPEDRAPQALVPALLAVLAPGRAIDPGTVVPDVATIVTNAIVVTEPDTLIPHRFVLRRRFVLTGSTPEEPHLALERGEEITRVCAWR